MSSSPAKRPPDTRDDPISHKKAKKSAQTDPTPESVRPDKKSKKPPDPEVELQQSLLRTDPALARRFLEALNERPQSVSVSKMARQFWAARSHLLRAYAFERDQKRANYNVLSEVKPRNVEGAVRLNITPEQVEDIFRQHPVVRQAYNETVPEKFKDNMSFWSRFFISRLFKKLKGERITDADDKDPVLDRYLGDAVEGQMGRQALDQQQPLDDVHVPHFIDLEGNEQNHSQRKGNLPDMTMRPNVSEKVPILRVLNSMSEKIMARVAPANGDPHAPIGLDEETFNQLRLRDLQGDTKEDRVVLNVNDQWLHSGGASGRGSQGSKESQFLPKQDPERVLKTLHKDLKAAQITTDARGTSSMNLFNAIGFPEIDDSDDDDASDEEADTTQKNSQNTSKALTDALRRATSQIHQAISLQITQLEQERRQALQQTSQHTSDPSTPSNGGTSLTPKTFQDLTLTHHTTNEFLSYFWAQLTSLTDTSTGQQQSAAHVQNTLTKELPAMLESLEKSLVRFQSVADAAEEERKAKLQELKTQAREAEMRLRRRVPVDEAKAGGGKKEVQELTETMVRAIDVAKTKFQEAHRGALEVVR